MASRLISYDLISPGRDYDDLHDAIKALGEWWHCLESVWIVKTEKTCAQVRDELSPHLDSNDKLAVFTLQGGWATTGMPKDCNDWLRNNL